MRNKLFGCVLLLGAGLFLAASAMAEQSESTPKPAKAPAKAPAPTFEAVLEPRAMELLKAASARLAAAKSMSFTAVATYELPSRLGPSIAYTTRSEVALQRPDKLRVITLGDGPAYEFYSDGKTIMAYAPAENLVAVSDAPLAIEPALKFAFDTAAIYFPFTDLMVPDPYAAIADGLKVAFYIGQSKVVGGTTTDMAAYASDDVFVQIWIGAEDKLPRRLRATYAKDPLQLRHDLEIADWQIDPAIAPEVFRSSRALEARRIEFARPPEVAPLPRGAKPPGKAQPANASHRNPNEEVQPMNKIFTSVASLVIATLSPEPATAWWHASAWGGGGGWGGTSHYWAGSVTRTTAFGGTVTYSFAGAGFGGPARLPYYPYHPPVAVSYYSGGCSGCAAAAGAVVGLAAGAAIASAHTSAVASNAYSSGYAAGAATGTANTAAAYQAGVVTGSANTAMAYNAGVAAGSARIAGGETYVIGASYASLPGGCVSPTVRGTVYYLCGNTWFKPTFGANGVYYEVVPAP